MASIIDSIDEILNDRNAKVKFLVLAVPIFFTYTLFKSGDIVLFYTMLIITSLLCITTLTNIINNMAKGKFIIIPGENIGKFIKDLIKITTCIVPLFIACSVLAFVLTKIQIPFEIDNIQIIYNVIIWLIFSSIMITSMISYARNENVKEAYDFKLISNHCIDVLIALFFYIIQLAIVNSIVIGIIAFTFNYFIGIDNLYFVAVCSIALAIDICITGHYLAQVEYEIFPHKNTEEHTIL